MKITFWSHSCFFIESESHRLVIDPFLTGNPKATVKPCDVNVDYVLITHGHGDHIGDAIEIARLNNATIISNFEIATYCGKQGVNIHPMHIGGARKFPFGIVKLTIAHHGSVLDTDQGLIPLGNPTGMLISTGGKTIFHAGDTGLFLDMKLIGEIHPIDIAMLPIGDNFTMGIDDACKAIEFLNPKLTIPMHFGTFELIDVDPDRFKSRAAAAGANVRVLDIGETLEC